MKKFAQLTLLVTILGLIQLGCDSVTDSNAPNTNNITNLNNEITPSSESDDADVVITGESPNWYWDLETGETGTGEFVAGPETPVIGSGSAQFILEDEEDGLALIGKLSDGALPLTDIEKLEYNTYQSASSSDQAVSLQLNINYNDEEEGWQGRLSFEPYYTEDVLQNEWQTWDALTQGAWWATEDPGNEVCKQNEPCSWNEILEAFPDAEVRAESELGNISLIHFKAGSNWGSFNGNVDGFTISIAGEELVYSFEAEQDDENGEDDNGENGDEEDDAEEPGDDPLSIEDCKEGGWEEYGFRNQGQCIRYVNTGQDSREEPQDGGENGDDEENGENGDSEEENGEDSDENGNNEDESDENNNDITNPSTIQDCQNGGWAEYGFRNQGQCIRYVNTGKDSREEPQDGEENGDDEENGENGEDPDENGESDDEENDENGNGSEDDENGDSDNGDESDENGENGDSDNDEEESNGVNGNGTSDDDEEENGDGETTTAGAGPSSVEDCRDGGWENYGFRNQGECVRTVRNGG